MFLLCWRGFAIRASSLFICQFLKLCSRLHSLPHYYTKSPAMFLNLYLSLMVVLFFGVVCGTDYKSAPADNA